MTASLMVAITNPPPDGLVAVAVGRRVTLSQLPHSLIIMYIILLFLPHPTHLILLFVLPSFCGQTSSFPPNTFVSLFLFTPLFVLPDSLYNRVFQIHCFPWLHITISLREKLCSPRVETSGHQLQLLCLQI